MRYIIIIAMSLFLATSTIAAPYCTINGPHNCNEQITDQLAVLTRRAANHIEATQDRHPFKTQNDQIMARATGNQEHRFLQCTNARQTFWLR